jgi:hypothetical protein
VTMVVLPLKVPLADDNKDPDGPELVGDALDVRDVSVAELDNEIGSAPVRVELEDELPELGVDPMTENEEVDDDGLTDELGALAIWAAEFLIALSRLNGIHVVS